MSKRIVMFLFVLVLTGLMVSSAWAVEETNAAKIDRLNKEALALYPSPLLVPIKEPYYFVWYLARPEVWRKLENANLTTYDSYEPWLQQKGGVLNLTWGEGGPAGWLPDAKAWVSYYADSIAGGGALGYCMHEWHFSEDDDEAKWATAAVRKATKKHPEVFSAFYYQGQKPMAEVAAEGNIDLLIVEGYMNVHKQFPVRGFQINMAGNKRRVDVSRRAGCLEQTIVMIGHILKYEDYHEEHKLTPEVAEQQIKELRAYAPEMPGIGFYGASPPLAFECDRLVAKYFIEPAPEVLIEEPKFQAIITEPQITVRAKATPKDGRTIAKYRWFIDNRLVAETKEPEYAWDVKDEIDGYHFVTVHAVDSVFNRAAAQILVTVELPGRSSTSGTKEFEERSVVETADIPIAPADESTIVGTWELTTTLLDGSHKGELIVNEDHSGTYDGPDGKLEISRLKIEGDKVSFRIMVLSPGDMFGDVRTDLKGVLQGDTLKGKWVNYRGGGPEEVTGKRIRN